MRAIFFLCLSAALVIGTGCGDDTTGGDTGTADTSTGDTSTGDTGTADTGTADTSTGDGSTGDGSTGDGSTGDGSTGDGSTGDGGGSSAEAIAYCTGYETTCGYATDANRFDDADACQSFFDAGDTGCTECLATHIALASDDAATHCPHATGMGPCNGACP